MSAALSDKALDAWANLFAEAGRRLAAGLSPLPSLIAPGHEVGSPEWQAELARQYEAAFGAPHESPRPIP
jgi:hypothetical protein